MQGHHNRGGQPHRRGGQRGRNQNNRRRASRDYPESSGNGVGAAPRAPSSNQSSGGAPPRRLLSEASRNIWTNDGDPERRNSVEEYNTD